MAVLSSIAGPPADLVVPAVAAMASARKAVLRELPARAVQCIRPAPLRVEALREEHVPALASALAWVRVPALASVQDLVERLDCCHQGVKLRVRSAPVRMRGVDASSIRRPKKAR